MKKRLILIALLFFLFPLNVQARDLELISENPESSEFTLDEQAGSVGQDPGTYLIAENGYAYTAPKVEDASLKVYDFADLLTNEQEADLTNDLIRAEQSKQATVIAVTTNNVVFDPNYGVENTRAYAEDFYDANAGSFQNDAFILCVDMNNRVLYTVGHGKYADGKYVSFEEQVYNDIYDEAREGDFHGAIKAYAQDVYRLENWRYAMIPTAGATIASVFGGLVTMLFAIGRHKKAAPSRANIPSVELLNGKPTIHDVNFLGTHTTTRIRPKYNDDHSSGGGGGGFSGGVHSSGGGGSFSGGGGHF